MTIYRIGSTGYSSSPEKSAKTGAEADFATVLHSSMTNSPAGLEGIFAAASKKYNVPVNLLKAVAKVESSFRANATSHCGAMGIMQLMPRTAKWLGVADAYDPEQNIMGGAKYLNMLLNKYGGDVETALAAYNAGPGTVKKYGGIPPFAQGYVNKVLRNCEGDISARLPTTAPDASPDAGEIFSAAVDESNADMLSSLLLTSMYQSQAKLMENMDGEQEERDHIF